MSDRQTIYLISATVSAACLGATAFFWWRKNYKYYPVGTVSHLNIYPVKSFKEVALNEATCTEVGLKQGLMADRQWVVTDSNYKFIPLKELPKMILIQPSFHNNVLHLDSPGMKTLKISVFTDIDNNNLKKCVVWNYEMEGLDCGDEAGKWLSKVVERENLRLIQYINGMKTKPLQAFPGLQFFGKKTDKAVFADASPYSLMSESSQIELKKHLSDDQQVPLMNFRPNIIISGSKPFEEDSWNRLKIGKNHFRFALRIPRCAATTIDRSSGTMGTEPLKTLRKFRSTDNKIYKKYFPGSPLYGVYLVPDIYGEPIKVGDTIYATYK